MLYSTVADIFLNDPSLVERCTTPFYGGCFFSCDEKEEVAKIRACFMHLIHSTKDIKDKTKALVNLLSWYDEIPKECYPTDKMITFYGSPNRDGIAWGDDPLPENTDSASFDLLNLRCNMLQSLAHFTTATNANGTNEDSINIPFPVSYITNYLDIA